MVTDAETAARVRRVLDDARRNGIALVDSLDRAEILLTPKRHRLIRLEALRELQRSLQQWRPAEYARRISHTDPVTPAQMLETLLSYVDEYVNAEARDGRSELR